MHTNKLINETSPYLLQHAHNPVNWFPWNDEALNRAKNENKPILVSIGYAACHWCHVMERESFENEETAAIMNENFINIKIDREERPDLDHIYMDAVQAMTGSGGWPLNVFLTPEGKPFYGGTYFPPQRAFNRPSWKEILLSVSQAFKERRHEIDAQAENLTEHLTQSNSFGFQKGDDDIFVQATLDEIFSNIIKQADEVWGGFGKAPKFPQTFTIQFLLRYHHKTKNKKALDQAVLSLDKMISGGIYDQVGGGFARYSTDTEWLAPHFEKMLYDNALLVSVISEAYQLTGHERYREVISETIGFVQRELTDASGGFYSALDADSEGEEGKFYVWNKNEVIKVLGEDAELFCAYYDITEKGNWEGKNILRVKTTSEEFAKNQKIDPVKLNSLLGKSKEKLLEKRSERARPSLDDKIILGWNALMNSALSKAFAATGEESYRQLAIDNMQFLLKNFKADQKPEPLTSDFRPQTSGFHHTWKNGKAKFPAFLDDYAFLISALIQLQEITADSSWLLKARGVTESVLRDFSDQETDLFYYTAAGQQDVIIRKKEIYDGALPSGNSVMATNLHYLAIVFDKKDWQLRSQKMVSTLRNVIRKYPTSFGNWAGLLEEITVGTSEIAITGKNIAHTLKNILKYYLPNRVLMAAESEEKLFPLLAGKPITELPSI